ncbi:MAG: malonyl-CoA synthase [Pseudomonadota bacterium]
MKENLLYDTLLAPHHGRQDLFLECPGGEDVTYDGFLRQAGQMAALMRRLGLVPGDRVAAQVEKSTAALALYAACARAGLVFLPLNPAYTQAELGYFLSDSSARLMVCDPSRAAGLAELCKDLGTQLETMDTAGGGSFIAQATEMEYDFQTVPRRADDLAALLYTSGTTGRSKGAMLSHGNLVSNAESLARAWGFEQGDVLIHALPIFHTHGLFVASNIILATGGRMVFLPKFDLDAVFAALPSATTMMGVPTFYTRLLADSRLDRVATAHMRLFVSGSAPLLTETHAQFADRTGHAILERYGMTETSMNTTNPYDGARRAGTVGMSLPEVELKITDPESGDPLPQGEIGQIEVRGPNVFQGYWNMPEKTAAELRQDGFFITGDLGRIDEKGYVQIVGRGKDLIISGGFNVYPKEVEQLLDAVDGVRESAVIGVPHDDFGEAVFAVLVPEAGVTLDPNAIGADLGQMLAKYKQPKAMVSREELPRNTMGKVQKNLLREEFKTYFNAS